MKKKKKTEDCFPRNEPFLRGAMITAYDHSLLFAALINGNERPEHSSRLRKVYNPRLSGLVVAHSFFMFLVFGPRSESKVFFRCYR